MTRVQPLRQFFAHRRPRRGLVVPDLGCATVSGLRELGFPSALRALVARLPPGRDGALIAPAAAALPAVYGLDTGLLAAVAQDRGGLVEQGRHGGLAGRDGVHRRAHDARFAVR